MRSLLTPWHSMRSPLTPALSPTRGKGEIPTKYLRTTDFLLCQKVKTYKLSRMHSSPRVGERLGERFCVGEMPGERFYVTIYIKWNGKVIDASTVETCPKLIGGDVAY